MTDRERKNDGRRMGLLRSVIINFHAVYDADWMEQTFLLLMRNYRLIGIEDLEEFYHGDRQLSNACHITFDDGDATFHKIVYPILKKHDIPVSIYVSPEVARERENSWFQEIHGYDMDEFRRIILEYDLEMARKAGSAPVPALLKSMPLAEIWKAIELYREETGTEPKPCVNMVPDQLRELHDSGLVVVGAHTLNHPILANETDANSAREIGVSIKDLGKMLDTRIRHFAYPNGVPDLDFGPREIETLRKSGITLAFSTESRPITRADDPLSIPRLGISYGGRPFVMAKLIAGRGWDVAKRVIKGKGESEFRRGIAGK